MTRDSSEIAAHLRTVHFSLILACTLAGISLSGQSPSKLDSVQDQLAQVIKIKTHWMTWTKRFGTEQITWLQNQGLASPQKLPGEVYIPAEELRRYNLPQSENGWTARPLYSPIYLHLSVNLPSGSRHEILGHGWPRISETELIPGGYDATGNPKLDSLEDFRFFWNAASTILAFVVKEISEHAFLVSHDKKIVKLPWIKPPAQRQGSQIILGRMNIGSTERGDECKGMQPLLLSAGIAAKFNTLFCGQAPPPPRELPSQVLVLPAVYQDQHIPINLQVWLGEHFKFPTAGTKFEETFSDLHEFIKTNPKIGFADLTRLLRSEMEREKQTERLELLGLRFREKDLANWGALILVVIQTYFWVHLRVLNSRLAADDPATKVAWIGLYSDVFARLVCIGTACGLPVTIMLYGISTIGFSYLKLFLLAVGALLAILTALLLTRIATKAFSE